MYAFSSKLSSIFVCRSWAYSKTRIILPDCKYRDALKIAKIDTLYDRRESLSLKLFNKISHTNDHKLASLLPPRSKCRKLRNNRTFDIPICKTDRYKKSFIISHLYWISVFPIFFKCRLIFSFNSFFVFILVIYFIYLLIDNFITVMYFICTQFSQKTARCIFFNKCYTSLSISLYSRTDHMTASLPPVDLSQ